MIAKVVLYIAAKAALTPDKGQAIGATQKPSRLRFNGAQVGSFLGFPNGKFVIISTERRHRVPSFVRGVVWSRLIYTDSFSYQGYLRFHGTCLNF